MGGQRSTVCSASVLPSKAVEGGHTPSVQAGAETPDTGADMVKPDPGSSLKGPWGGRLRGGCQRCQCWGPESGP